MQTPHLNTPLTASQVHHYIIQYTLYTLPHWFSLVTQVCLTAMILPHSIVAAAGRFHVEYVPGGIGRWRFDRVTHCTINSLSIFYFYLRKCTQIQAGLR